MRIVVDAHQPLAEEAFGQFGEVTVVPGEQIDNALLRGADALICRSTVRVNEQLLAGTAVRFVGTCTIGFDHVDIDYLTACQIGFASAPGCNANSVAEYIVAAILTYAVENNISLADRTLGIVGVGNVGKMVARRAAGLGLKILLCDPPRARLEGEAGFTEMGKLLADSDFVTLHVPLIREGTDATLNMADVNFFAAMRRGSVFINASRGKVVRESALIDALQKKHLAAAILDVFATEPLPDAQLLQQLFIATPHIAGYSFDGKINGGLQIAAAMGNFFGLQSQWKPEIVLPDLAVSKIDIQSDASLEVELLDAINAVYNIRRDHRALMTAPRHFAQLRADYPQRFEFFHTDIVPPVHREDLRQGFADIGFNVVPW